MRLGIMQPYFLPYIGYFQLLNYCDTFVLYDDIEYTKKGWITRNRIQFNGDIRLFSLNLKKDSDYLSIKDRSIAESFDRSKLLRSFEGVLRKTPHYEETIALLRPIVSYSSNDLFPFLENSIALVCQQLGVTTNFVKSSDLDIDPRLRGQQRVLEICSRLNAEEYVNPIGGIDLYDVASFKNRGVNLGFLRSKLSPYFQGDFDFIPALSIVDQLVFCGAAATKMALEKDFDLVKAQ
jgi:hypothetical protein